MGIIIISLLKYCEIKINNYVFNFWYIINPISVIAVLIIIIHIYNMDVVTIPGITELQTIRDSAN